MPLEGKGAGAKKKENIRRCFLWVKILKWCKELLHVTLALKDNLYIKAHGINLTGGRFLSPNKQPVKMNWGTRTSLPEKLSWVNQ